MEFQAGTTRGIAGVQSARWIQIEKNKVFCLPPDTLHVVCTNWADSNNQLEPGIGMRLRRMLLTMAKIKFIKPASPIHQLADSAVRSL